MATAVAGGLFNAFAFAGAGWLFSTFKKNDYTKEAKRHNLATEELTKAKELFYEQETKRNDKIRQLQDEIRTAKYDMQDTSKAFAELQQLHQNELIEPKLEDFYQPSEEMKKYQLITVTLAGSGLGLLIYTIL